MKEGSPQKTIEDWKRIYLQRFKDFHDNFSDEIPKEIVTGKNEENYKYKVRINWFAAIKNSFQSAALMNIFPEDFNEEYTKFFRTYDERMASDKGRPVRTTKEEIDTANNLLKKAQEIINNSLE